jgi:hypothetical protein
MASLLHLSRSWLGQLRSGIDIQRWSLKTCVLLLLVALPSLFSGCRRPYEDAAVVGSWQIVERRVKLNDEFFPSWSMDTNPVPQTFTFSSDHTFTSRFISTKDLRSFGVWAIQMDCLAITVRSNSVFPVITSNRESARIVRLTESLLTLENRDHRDQLQQRTFRRMK